jgi:hypothetical protein
MNPDTAVAAACHNFRREMDRLQIHLAQHHT